MSWSHHEEDDIELAKSFWNASAEWRTTYFDELIQANPESLSPALRAEREFIIGETEFINRCIDGATSILEVGCGVGRTLIPLAARYVSQRFIGLDYACDQLHLYNQKARRLSPRNAVCIECDVRRVPLVNEWSDLTLVVNQTLGTLSGRHRQTYLREINRITRLSGQLYAGCFTNIDLASQCYKEWGVSLRSIDRSSHLVQLESYSSLWAPEHQIVEELRTVGFAPVKIEYATLGFFGLFKKTSKIF